MISYQRPQSVSSMKGKGPKSELQNAPKLGTKTRAVYDVLVENMGRATVLPDYKNLASIIHQLQLFYALDIRIARQGSHIRGRTLYILAGYWDSDVYHDLIAD